MKHLAIPLFFLTILFLLASHRLGFTDQSARINAAEPLLKDLSALRLGPLQPEPERRLFESLERALLSYETVKDYRAIFIKTEREASGLGAPEEIYFKFEKPFKILMKWLNHQKKGLQVFYERGRNQGKLVIHKPGLLLGLVPVLVLDPNSPWVRQGSASYDIEDAGIGRFLTDFTNAVIHGAKEKKLKVDWQDQEQAEVTFPNTTKDEVYFASRINVSFDQATGLPIKMTLSDWTNQTIGIYEYQGLKLNGGSDGEFRKEINRDLMKYWLNGAWFEKN